MRTFSTPLALWSFIAAALLVLAQAEVQASPPATHTVQAQAAGGVQRVEGVVEAERQAVLSVPVQGAVIELKLRAGDAVKAGQALAVMEAMKMEHTLTCPRDGVVTELLYAVGDQLSDGAELLKLAEA